MKTSKFVKWQLKKWLPFFAVITIVVLATVTINASTFKITYLSRESIRFVERVNNSSDNSGLQIITSVMAIPIFVIPFFVFSHRFDKNAADAYKAFPAPKRRITRTKILIGGAFILALTIVAFLIFVGIILIRYSSTPTALRIDAYYYECKFKYYFIWYLPAFFYLVISFLVSYLFNCTLVSFGNNGVTAFIYLLFGSMIMFLGIYSLMYSFVYLTVKIPYGSQLYYMFRTSSISWYGTILARTSFVNDTFSNLIFTNNVKGYVASEGFFSVGKIIGYLTYAAEIAIGVLSFFTKEPSGEHYGAPGARKESDKCIVYVGIGVIILSIANMLSSSSFSASDLLIFLFVGTLIYFTFVIFNKRFSLNLNETIVIICLGFFFIVATIYTRVLDEYKPVYEYIVQEDYYGVIKYGLQTLSSILRN